VVGTGVNSANYNNPKYDRLFEQIKSMENSPERLEKIREMVRIVQEDAPWVIWNTSEICLIAMTTLGLKKCCSKCYGYTMF